MWKKEKSSIKDQLRDKWFHILRMTLFKLQLFFKVKKDIKGYSITHIYLLWLTTGVQKIIGHILISCALNWHENSRRRKQHLMYTYNEWKFQNNPMIYCQQLAWWCLWGARDGGDLAAWPFPEEPWKQSVPGFACQGHSYSETGLWTINYSSLFFFLLVITTNIQQPPPSISPFSHPPAS